MVNAATGEVAGVGVELFDRDGECVVSDIQPNSPAKAAGVEVGDVITEADGTTTKGASIIITPHHRTLYV